MSAVEVDIGEDIPIDDVSGQRAGPEPEADPDPDPDRGRRKRRRRDGPNDATVEVEREVTKRQLIESVTTVLVVVLYMIFTLVRDRESGVVVIEPDERDDWAE